MLTAGQITYLNQHRVARLATVGSDGQPHLVPVCFAVEGGIIYTPLDGKPKRVPAERLRRVQDLAANPACCLLVDTYDDDWTLLRWFQVRGTARIEPFGGTAQARAVAALRRRYEQYRLMTLEELPVIEITPVEVREWAWSGRTAEGVRGKPARVRQLQGPQRQ